MLLRRVLQNHKYNSVYETVAMLAQCPGSDALRLLLLRTAGTVLASHGRARSLLVDPHVMVDSRIVWVFFQSIGVELVRLFALALLLKDNGKVDL